MDKRVKDRGPLDGATTSRFPRGGRLLGPLFGLVFLIYPIRAVLTSDPTPVRVVLALGGAALFAGVFLWLMWTQEPLWSASVESSEVRKRRATIALLAVLAIALNLILGSEWRVLFFHLNVAAGIMLLTRDAYVAIVALATITFGLGIFSGMAWLALPTAAIGLWATAFVRQVAAVAELRSAREELARLAVSEERLRFARDLHDLLGHSLSLITLKSELAGRLPPRRRRRQRQKSTTSKAWRVRPCVRFARPSPDTGSPRSTRSSPGPARCSRRPASPAGSRTMRECYLGRSTLSSPGRCGRERRT